MDCHRARSVSDVEDQVEYEKINVEEYEKKYKDAQIKYIKKKAGKFGFQLVPA